MYVFLVGTGIAIVLSLLVALAYYERGQGKANITTKPTVAASAASASAPVSVQAENNGDAEERAKVAEQIEHNKHLLHALMLDASNSLANMMGNAEEYSDSLDSHRSALDGAASLAKVMEVQRILIKELDSMKGLTTRYREQLSAARQTIRTQQETLSKFREEAGLDTLLRIPNRGTLDRRLDEEFARARRYKHALTLILIDIDFFKEVNDTYGHLTGDRVLQGVAQVLNEQCRQNDFLARFGGEEFALLLPQTDLKQARLMAERIRRRVEGCRFVHNNNSVYVTCSAGLAQFADEEDGAESLLSRADAALYEAKRDGRNRVIVEPQSSDVNVFETEGS